MSLPAPTPLLTIDDLAVSFASADGRRVQAVDGVRLSIHAGRTLAVVGESGCGKSVTAMSVLRLNPVPPARYERGRITLRANGTEHDILRLPARDLRRIRGGEAAMIFQEPMTSLNPVFTVGEQIVEAVLLHQRVSAAEARDIAAAALTEVGIADAGRRMRAYPHEFSGGMRQRVMIAMALACRPRLLLADEPTTALDATTQAQILDLLRRVQHERGMGMMLITHALGLVSRQADAACVMYAGRVVEYATVAELFREPMHPYTRGLMRSSPRMREPAPRLTTVREIVDDPREFARLPGGERGLRPWWPAHAPPKDLCRAVGPAGEYLLHEATAGHWVGVWRTEAVAAVPARVPNLADPRPSGR